MPNAIKHVLNLTIFIACFFVASTFRFQHQIYEGNHRPEIIFPLIGIAAIGGMALAFFLSSLHLFPKAILPKILLGVICGIGIHLSVFAVEDWASERRLSTESEPAFFEGLRGHCGVYLGRALIRIYHTVYEPSLGNEMRDLAISNHCRLEHFRKLKEKGSACKPDENRIVCMSRWMNAFAQKGYWTSPLRSYFLNEVKAEWERIPNPEEQGNETALIEYALKDHDLEIARPSLVSQSGLKEEFSEQFILIKSMEDLASIRISQDVMTFVKSSISHPKEADHELLARFEDTQKEIQFQAEKIPDLEHDIAELRKRLSPVNGNSVH